MRAKPTWPIVAGLLVVFAAGPAAVPDEPLPLVRVPAAPGAGGHPMVLLLSGDGDWSAFVRDLAAAAAAGGSPVLGLEARSYFATPRTPDLAIRPEVEKLGAIPLLCMRGASEQGSFCERPVAGMRTLVHPGGHRAPSDPGTIALLLRELELAE